MGSVGQRDTLVWCGGRQQISEVSTVLRVVGSTVLRVVGSTVLRVVGSTVLRVVGSRDVLDDILDQAHIDAWLGWAGLCLAEPGHGWQCGRPIIEVFILDSSLGVVKLSTGVSSSFADGFWTELAELPGTAYGLLSPEV